MRPLAYVVREAGGRSDDGVVVHAEAVGGGTRARVAADTLVPLPS